MTARSPMLSTRAFFARPPFYCARCGHITHQEIDPLHPARRTIQCLNPQCNGYREICLVLDHLQSLPRLKEGVEA